MFWPYLSTEERGGLLILAAHLVAADGVIHEKETQLLEKLAKDMKLSVPERPLANVDVVAALFTTVRARHVVMLELISLAHEDGEYNIKELALLLSLARRFKLAPGRLQEMEQLQKDLREIGERLSAMITAAS